LGVIIIHISYMYNDQSFYCWKYFVASRDGPLTGSTNP